MATTKSPSSASRVSLQNKHDHKRRQKTIDDPLSTVHTSSDDIRGDLQLEQQRSHPQTKLQHPPPPSCSDRKSTVIYAGPHFMNDAPSPSLLPLPTEARCHYKQPHGFYSSYRSDPLFEIQDKLRTILKIKI
ncbi:hypothetical protein [Absidia glauca]|uniref:Uncharacterized protein n=1 Tax=Absidia glauca TaxID=4829 RepID=A0A163LYU9_ABSGL|nr:hypothetical protein [Absidia glauca]